MMAKTVVVMCIVFINLVKGNEESPEAVTRTFTTEENTGINEHAYNSRNTKVEVFAEPAEERSYDLSSEEPELNDDVNDHTFENYTPGDIEAKTAFEEHKDIDARSAVEEQEDALDARLGDTEMAETEERLEIPTDVDDSSSLEETIVNNHDTFDPEERIQEISTVQEAVSSGRDDSETDPVLDRSMDAKTSSESDTMNEGRMIQDVLVETKGRMASASSELEDFNFTPPGSPSLPNFRTMDSQLPPQSLGEILFPQYYKALKGYTQPSYNPISKQPPIYNRIPNIQNYRRAETSIAGTDGTYNHHTQDIETRIEPRILEFNVDSNAYPYSPIETTVPSLATHNHESKGINFYNQLVEAVNKQKQKPRPYPYINEQFYPEIFYANRYYPGVFNPYVASTRFP